MKVVIEGPSAIGKTSLCNNLLRSFQSVVLEETIIKPIENYSPYEEAIYYMNYEMDRWKKSESLSGSNELVIFDTDPFKSLWFNWSLGFQNCLTLDELDGFLRTRIDTNKIGFPDLYIVLKASQKELLHRKQVDKLRHRENFDWISKVNPYRNRYFEFIHSIEPERVIFLNAEVGPKELFSRTIELIKRRGEHKMPDNLYSRIIEWIRENS